MKRLLCLSAAAFCCSAVFSQVSFNNTVETGITMPLNGSAAGKTRNGNGIHIGNHLDMLVGSDCFNWGIGAYMGHTSSLGTDNKYREEGVAIAEKYRLTPSMLNFNTNPFQSTQFLLGPVVSAGSGAFNVRLWAKGGIGLNQAGSYAVIYREGNTEQKVYTLGNSESRNGLAYDLGAGFSYLFSGQLGFQLSASYNSTKTDMVGYNYDREKGTSPSYSTAKNSFVKASAGLVFHLHNTSSREAGSGMATVRRMHKPRRGGDSDAEAYNTREAGSGMATGRRQYKPILIRIDGDNLQVNDSPLYDDGGYEPTNPMSGDSVSAKVTTPRDAASGMATGKRMHKPIVVHIDDEGDAQLYSDRDAASGLATGKRMHKPVVITIEMDGVAQAVVIENPLYQGSSGATTNPMSESRSSGVNPLYEDKGNSGVNPMYKGAARDANGKSISEKGIKRSADMMVDPPVKSDAPDSDNDSIDLIILKGNSEYRVKVKYTTRRRVEVLKSN